MSGVLRIMDKEPLDDYQGVLQLHFWLLLENAEQEENAELQCNRRKEIEHLMCHIIRDVLSKLAMA